MIDEQLFKEAESNSTFDLEALEKSLADIKQTSFNYLYEFQKNAVNYKKFDFTMSDFQLDKNTSRTRTASYPKKYVIHIPSNFISQRKRYMYKQSAHYGKELNVFQVANDPNVFTRVYLVFIDGKYYDTINIRCKENVTELILDIQDTKINPTGVPQTHFNTLVQNNAKVTVFFVPNATYGLYNTNYNVMKLYKNQLALSNLNISGNLTTQTQYITFINTNDLLFSSVITDTSNSTDMLRFYDNNLRAFDSKYVHLNVFGFRNLLDQYNIPGATKFFKIPLQDMPVPVENLMIFTNDADGNKKFAHDISVVLHYPNIYEIVGNTTNANLTIYAFYFDDSTSQGLKFNNDLDLYQKLFGSDVGRYINNTIPDVVKSYQPSSYSYDINDFQSSIEYNDHLKYKIDKLKTWITENPEVLRLYLNNQIKTPTGFIIDVAQVNLSSKLRNNNFAEVDYEYEKKIFSEPRYLFILSNGSTDLYSDVRFYIDGLLYVPDETYKDSGYEYYYIPTAIVKSNSIIEVERFSEIEFQKMVTLNSPLDKVILNPRSDWTFNATDIYIVDPTVNKFISRDSFKVVITRNNIDIELDSSSLKSIKGPIGIRITDPALLARPVYVFIRRHIYFDVRDIKENDDIGTVFSFRSKTNFDVKNVRVFKNGRFLPSSLYDIDFENKVNGMNFITPLIRKQIGDKFVVDCTPYKYKTVTEINSIDPTGFVNLRGIVDKPFDLKWYDVYLNGRRLNKNQIEIVSPTLIYIKNVTSLKHFILIEKDRDTEYFNIGAAKTINDTLWDDNSEFKIALNNRPTISDSETDIVTELENSIELEKMKMFLVIIGREKLVNPDEFQITEEDQQRFPNMFNPAQDFFFIDPDENFAAVSRIKIFPEFKL